MQITSYLNKLGLKTKPHRNLWCFSKGKPAQKTSVTKGYEIGTNEGLKDRILEHEEIQAITSQ